MPCHRGHSGSNLKTDTWRAKQQLLLLIPSSCKRIHGKSYRQPGCGNETCGLLYNNRKWKCDEVHISSSTNRPNMDESWVFKRCYSCRLCWYVECKSTTELCLPSLLQLDSIVIFLHPKAENSVMISQMSRIYAASILQSALPVKYHRSFSHV